MDRSTDRHTLIMAPPAEADGSFSAMFASASAVYWLAGLLWFRIDPTRAVAE